MNLDVTKPADIAEAAFTGAFNAKLRVTGMSLLMDMDVNVDGQVRDMEGRGSC